MSEEQAKYETNREREGNLGGFSYVDVTTEGCEGWLNLFWGDYPVALVNDVHLAAEMRNAIQEQSDRAECIDNLVGKLYRERDTQATELADKETDLQQARVERDDLSYKLRASTIQRDGLRTALDATSKLANDSLTELDQLRPKLAKAETEKGTLREALEAACELAEDMMLLLCLTTRAGKWIAELERLEGIAKQTKGE